MKKYYAGCNDLSAERIEELEINREKHVAEEPMLKIRPLMKNFINFIIHLKQEQA